MKHVIKFHRQNGQIFYFGGVFRGFVDNHNQAFEFDSYSQASDMVSFADKGGELIDVVRIEIFKKGAAS